MASFWTSFLAIFILSMASHSSLALQSQPETQFSSISAAPAFLPGAPLSSSPTLSPDISPLFPSPGGVPLSPSESSLPTIPASPSPPNPEVNVAPGPDQALAPSGSLPVSYAVSVTSSLPINVMFFLGLLASSFVYV
ncbi:classical arabinogalactan protein 26-like [Pyrus communis]|uniref:classical arabinogalactan protein 26-like n=1 Tax=Pyrus communis TaxID=23211 RepID=UPI0035BFF953